MKRNENRFRQTHFVGVLLPDGLSEAVDERRAFMEAEFGCRSGHGTAPHVTLAPPFALPEGFSTADVVSAVRGAAEDYGGTLPFGAEIDGFGAFGDRTVFARVVLDDNWRGIRRAVLSALSEKFGIARRGEFAPHVTVANRDIPEGASVRALAALSSRPLSAGFPVDNLAVFTRTASGGWSADERNVVRISPQIPAE